MGQREAAELMKVSQPTFQGSWLKQEERSVRSRLWQRYESTVGRTRWMTPLVSFSVFMPAYGRFHTAREDPERPKMWKQEHTLAEDDRGHSRAGSGRHDIQ